VKKNPPPCEKGRGGVFSSINKIKSIKRIVGIAQIVIFVILKYIKERNRS